MLGALGRTLVKYVQKYISGEVTSFDNRYLASLFVAAIMAVMGGLTYAVGFSIPSTVTGNAQLFLMVLTTSYTANDLINIVVPTPATNTVKPVA